jgi:hypothetical protein
MTWVTSLCLSQLLWIGEGNEVTDGTKPCATHGSPWMELPYNHVDLNTIWDTLLYLTFL